MPVVPPVTATTPYDTAQYVLNLARALVNDAGISIAGNLLSDNQPYTFVLLNSAWRTLQDELMNNGVETFPAEIVISSIPVVADLDPASQVTLSYTGFYDSANNTDTPVLPQDMIIPLRIWERQNGTEQVFQEMFPVNDGLPSRPKTLRLVEWEWRADAIYMVGATQVNDLRVRYNRYLADISADPSSPVPILRCAKALACYLAAEFAGARGSPFAATLTERGDAEVMHMVTRTTRKQQRGNHRRIGYSRRGNTSNGFNF